MAIYILDIETKPDESLKDIFDEGIKAPKTIKDPEKIEANIEKQKEQSGKKMAVDTDYNKILCIGIKELGKEGKIYDLSNIESFFKKVRLTYWQLVTFNGKSFDLPTLIKNGLKKGLDLPYQELYEMSSRYNSDRHYDLMTILGSYNSYRSLDTYLRIYCGTKKETLGDEFFATATDEEIIQHCLEDLDYTEQLFNKFKPLLSYYEEEYKEISGPDLSF